MTQDDKTPPAKDVQGEGDYDASRRFDAEEKAFVEKNRAEIPKLARAAKDALDGPEGEELRQAEASGRTHTKA